MTDEAPTSVDPQEPSSDPVAEGAEPADAADDASAQALAPHRVVFHALVVGLCGGLVGGGMMAFGQSLRSSGLRGRVLLLCLVIACVWCALLGGSSQIARRVRPALRWLMLLVVGATAALFMACAVVGVEGLLRGGPAEGWLKLVRFLEQLFVPNDTTELLGIGVGTLLPFLALGTTRAGFGPKPSRWWVQLIACLFGSLAGYASFVLTVRGSMDTLYGFVFVVGGGFGAGVGMALGDLAERALLRWLTRLRDGR